ncbi:LexA family protein [Roseateles terrae]|uniref:SOS-response transcriptional repressor LexA n=1 Tax=Roseateles terrae TaxID=431060 RepID=A0ABR6GPD2_9BURK|nr:hypothetical protein [Roseateles terrae]MBB3193968.1 SOS-response transcriptional repressor LexA [Roseateles terrae]OWQ87844.1 hypothetical protein CDN98_06675 [Roseateles terrae]
MTSPFNREHLVAQGVMPKAILLTATQSRVLEFVREYRRRNQMPPTQAEIQQHFGWASPNAVTDHLKALERKGAIRIGANKARAIFDLETV